MFEQPGDASGDIYAALYAGGVTILVAVALGFVGFFYPPAWALLTCVIGHLNGSVSGACI